MSTQTIVSATPGLNAIAVSLADANAPADIEQHPVLFWSFDERGQVLPITALGASFKSDGVEYAPLDGCRFVCTDGTVYTDIDKYIDARREALRDAVERKAAQRARRAAEAAVLKLRDTKGVKAAIAVLERFRPAGCANQIVTVSVVPDSRLSALHSAAVAEIECAEATAAEIEAPGTGLEVSA